MTEIQSNQTLMSMLYRTSATYPDQIALIFGKRSFTYSQLAEKVERLAESLAGRGIIKGTRVGLVLPNVPEFVISFLAIAKLGAIAVTLDPKSHQLELEGFFPRADVELVITTSQNRKACANYFKSEYDSRTLITDDATSPQSFWTFLLNGSPGNISHVNESDPLLCQFTSGSMGESKIVTRTQQQCWWEAENFVESTKTTERDRIISLIPLFHSYGLGNCLLAAIKSGATLVLMEAPHPLLLMRMRVLDVLAKEGITMLSGVPEIFRLLAEIDTTVVADLSKLRLCISGGSPLPISTFEKFQRRYNIAIRQQYGCTEAGSLTLNLSDNPAETIGAVGQPLGQNKIKVISVNGDLAAGTTTGEIVVQSRAHHQSHEDSNEFFSTGDLGYLDHDGNLWITGRAKGQISVAGNKVSPADVEDVLKRHDKVREVVVVGLPGNLEGDEIIKAVVVADKGVDETELILFCRERLPNFKVPAVIEFRKSLERNEMGKIRAALMVSTNKDLQSQS